MLYNILEKNGDCWEKFDGRKRKIEVGTYVIPCRIEGLSHRNTKVKIRILVDHNFSNDKIKKGRSKNESGPGEKKKYER